MSKRLLSLLLIISILMSSSLITSVDAESRASDYFIRYSATLSTGDSAGELNLIYRVSTSVVGITRLGIIALFVYRTDGSIAKLVTGNTSNGLLVTSGTIAVGTYSFTMEPGVAYYCAVRFIAENASGNDIRYYTTNTVIAPL